ncbi:hypothetical protein GCM10025864_41460 [Luteimicrobium album]|uniref:Uncharacterized protein n=1 Tax=Luteimicrobium album TaxID=1054550 RepID=A0ABQ6I839_9MICO|nr:hypothetical protein GCM10025864_41460 [Luteimicrobium album]
MRRATEGRAARASAVPGSVRASDSRMPIATSVVTSALPPAEMSGSGTPMTGMTPITTPTFTRACPTIQQPIAAAATFANGSS